MLLFLISGVLLSNVALSSLVHRPSTPPAFDRFQYAKTEGRPGNEASFVSVACELHFSTLALIIMTECGGNRDEATFFIFNNTFVSVACKLYLSTYYYD